MINKRKQCKMKKMLEKCGNSFAGSLMHLRNCSPYLMHLVLTLYVQTQLQRVEQIKKS